MFSFFKNLFTNNDESWRSIIPILESGDEHELNSRLWRQKGGPINFLPVTTFMLQKLARPNVAEKGLQIHDVWRKGKFILVVFELPWDGDDFKYSPLIIDISNNKVAGIMLPFNELHGIITNAESKQIGDLGARWALWTFKKRFDT